MNAIAQYHANSLLEGSPVAKEQRRTLLAMPVDVMEVGGSYNHSGMSIEFKQYTFYDLERRGLVELKMSYSAQHSHDLHYGATCIGHANQTWMLTALGAEVVVLLKEAAP
jgi:hypothetical protein